MSKETFDFSEALRRMKEGKKVRRKIFADGTYAYIDKNYLGSEALMYNSVGRAAPVLWLLPETIFATDWEGGVRMKKKILTLTISKQWFDMIADGRKNEEYRDIKPYWASRLVNQQAEGGEVLFDEYGGYCCVTGKPEYKPFTHVLFINGY